MRYRPDQLLKLSWPSLLMVVTLLIFAPILLDAQTITGKVYRFGTDTVITGASVYYGGSMAGTATDKAGNFQLQAQAQQIPVIVSCIGYYSATETYSPGKPLIIYLKPKTEQLRTVTIRVDGMNRKDEVAIFTREFIGTSTFAKSCTITNIDDVDFFYSKKTQTLTASCDKPIIVENKKLGYTISYFLDSFKWTAAHVNFIGNFIFKEHIPLSADSVKIKRNRETAYKNSRMQFVRHLWSHRLPQGGFNTYTFATSRPLLKPIAPDSILAIDSLHQQYVHLNSKLCIINDKGERTGLLSTEKYSFINKNGFYGAGLQWSGAMAEQRIGDLLPFEFQSEQELNEPASDNAALATNLVNYSPVVMVQPASKTAVAITMEKVYLHTDRDTYAQGDTIWFKAYLVNAQSHQLINSSNTLYVQLITPDSAKFSCSKLIRLDNGLGNGDIALTDSIPSGKYRLRAYTNWMRNFGDNFIFETPITVLNTQASVVKLNTKSTVANKGKAARKTTVVNAALNTANIAVAPTVRFYPEGGSLVKGISSLVAVKAEDGYGKGIVVTGSVLSSAGDTVSHFKCDSLGMGLFALLPVQGQTYHAVINPVRNVLSFKQNQIFELPSALNKGLTLQAKQIDSAIYVVVSKSESAGEEIITVTNHPVAVNMLVKHSGKILLVKQLMLHEAQTAVKIPTIALPEGISAITIYNNDGKPECERLIYIHHPGKAGASITTDKKNYQPWERITVNISSKPNANLSMAVIDAGAVPEQAGDIVSYLQLQSEIKGDIEDARRYFDTTNINRFRQLDLLLLTQGWRDFVWRRLADTAIHISYAAETGVNLSGKVRDENRNKWLPNLNISLFADRASGEKIFSTKSDSSGRFNFSNLMLYGKQLVKLSATDSKGKIGGALWIDTLQPIPVQQQMNKATGGEAIRDSITTTALKKKITANDPRFAGITALKEVNITGNKYKNYQLSDGTVYALWGTTLNQSFNITPKDYDIKTLQWYALYHIYGARPNLTTSGIWIAGGGAPILIINGVVKGKFDNTDYYSLPIDRFKRIQTKRVIITGGSKIPRMAVVYLLFLDLKENYNIDNPGILNVAVEGYDERRIFYKPLNEKDAAKYDYRTTIHWEPDIKTDDTGKATVSFYNTAKTNNIQLIVQGITSNGEPVAERVSIK